MVTMSSATWVFSRLTPGFLLLTLLTEGPGVHAPCAYVSGNGDRKRGR